MYKFNNSEVDLSIPFPRKMLVWNNTEENAHERVVIAITSAASDSYKVLAIDDPDQTEYRDLDMLNEYKNAKEIGPPVTSKANIVNIKGHDIDMSEPFPRRMMVTDKPIDWKQRKVLYVDPNPKARFVATAVTLDEEDFDVYDSTLWENVKELPKPKELTLDELLSIASKYHNTEVKLKD